MVLTGRDKVFTRVNALKWMRANVRLGTTPATLAETTARAFDVWTGLLENYEPDEHWIHDLAIAVIAASVRKAARTKVAA